MGLRYLIGSFFVSSSPSISEGFEESNGYIKRNLGLKGDFVPKKNMPKGEQMWSNPLHETTLEHENGLYIFNIIYIEREREFFVCSLWIREGFFTKLQVCQVKCSFEVGIL